MSAEDKKARRAKTKAAWYLKNRESIVAQKKRYRAEVRADPERSARLRIKEAASWAKWREKYPEKWRATLKRASDKYWATEKAKAHRRSYQKNYLKTNVSFAIAKRTRERVRCALIAGRAKRASRTSVLLGCSIPELKAHLENLFQPGMTWENRGQWEIDHIRPCASFNLLDPDQQRCCFHFSNLQPLWRADNRLKRDKI